MQKCAEVDQEVRQVLEELKLSRYAANFAKEGFITLDDLSAITFEYESKLEKRIGIDNLRDLFQILNWAKQYRGTSFIPHNLPMIISTTHAAFVCFVHIQMPQRPLLVFFFLNFSRPSLLLFTDLDFSYIVLTASSSTATASEGTLFCESVCVSLNIFKNPKTLSCSVERALKRFFISPPIIVRGLSNLNKFISPGPVHLFDTLVAQCELHFSLYDFLYL
jgi:hypothetical protein